MMSEGRRKKRGGRPTRKRQRAERWQDKVETCVSPPDPRFIHSFIHSLGQPRPPIQPRPPTYSAIHPCVRPSVQTSSLFCSCPVHGPDRPTSGRWFGRGVVYRLQCSEHGGTYTCIIMEPASADDLLQSGIMLAGTHCSAWVGTWDWGVPRPTHADYGTLLLLTRAMRRRPQEKKIGATGAGRGPGVWDATGADLSLSLSLSFPSGKKVAAQLHPSLVFQTNGSD